jgi:hypothetical protein
MASIAMALPILPGQAEGIRRMREEALGPRRSEYEEARRRMGVTKEKAWVQSTPMGEMALVYWEVEGPQRALRQLAESQDQFDEWFSSSYKTCTAWTSHGSNRLPASSSSIGRLADLSGSPAELLSWAPAPYLRRACES